MVLKRSYLLNVDGPNRLVDTCCGNGEERSVPGRTGYRAVSGCQWTSTEILSSLVHSTTKWLARFVRKPAIKIAKDRLLSLPRLAGIRDARQNS